MEANLLNALGIASKEDVISNLLAFCLEKSPRFRAAFLRALGSNSSYDLLEGRTRTRLSEAGIPDIVLLAKRRGPIVDWFVIENKLNAEEGDDQTTRYASPQAVRELKRKFSIPFSLAPHFIFLTLYPDQKPQSSRFRKVTYEQLVQMVSKTSGAEGNPTAKRLMGDLCSVVTEFYRAGRLVTNEKVVDKFDSKLVVSGGLEGLYLWFCNLVGSVQAPAGML